MFMLMDFCLLSCSFLSSYFFLLEKKLFILCQYMLEVVNFLFVLTGACNLEFALNLRGNSGIRLFSSAETGKTSATVRDALNTLHIKGCS